MQGIARSTPWWWASSSAFTDRQFQHPLPTDGRLDPRQSDGARVGNERARATEREPGYGYQQWRAPRRCGSPHSCCHLRRVSSPCDLSSRARQQPMGEASWCTGDSLLRCSWPLVIASSATFPWIKMAFGPVLPINDKRNARAPPSRHGGGFLGWALPDRRRLHEVASKRKRGSPIGLRRSRSLVLRRVCRA